MKLESFGEHPAKTACPGKIWFFFYDFYRKRCRILEWSIQFWVDISSLISRMDFILHISIVLNDLNNLATISLMQDHSKILKMHFEWSKEPKWRFLAVFWSLVCWTDLILHIVIVLNVFQLLATLPCHEGSFKNHKNAFLNDPRSKKRGFWPFSGVWSVGSTWYCILW